MRNRRTSAWRSLTFPAALAAAIIMLCSATAFSYTSSLLTQRGSEQINAYFVGLNAPVTATASGTLSGTATGSQINLSDENGASSSIPGLPGVTLGQNFNVGATFSIDVPLVGTLGPYGMVAMLDFNASATAPQVTYNLPYNLNVGGIPAAVSPGQTIPLDTTFDWTGAPVITSTQTVSFSTKVFSWIDLPLDGLGAATIMTTHTPDPFLFNSAYSNGTLTTTASIPGILGLDGVELPGIPAPVGNEVDTSDFTGYPATAVLAGVRDVNASSTPWLSADVNSTSAYFGNTGVSADAWGISGDLLPIVGEALLDASAAYPPLAVAGGALKALDIPFSVPAEISIDIRRTDWMYVELAALPAIEVSAAQSLGNDQTLVFNDVPLEYRYMSGASYWYDMNFTLGIGVDLTVYQYSDTLFDIQLGSMQVGGAATGLQNATSLFDLTISGIDVVAPTGSTAFDHTMLQLLDLNSLPYAFSPSAGDIAAGATSNIFSDPVPVPTPEPGTLMLLGSGLAGLAAYGRRRLKI